VDCIEQIVDIGTAPVADTDDPLALRKYMKLKLAVTRQLQFLERLFQVRGRKDQELNCRQILTKLAEDRFTLAVVGQFKRGKSSLINALIGGELLSTGLLPLTSAITILRFGGRPRLVIQWMNSSFEDERPVSALPEFVTEQGNPGNCKHIRAVYVETNSPFLRRGVELVDTPGIGSAIESNTITTEAFLPHCDAVVFVTAVDTPMTELELAFLARLRHDVKKIFCVVNKTDLLAEPQLSEVMEFVRSQIKSCLGQQAMIFPVSARSSLSSVAMGANAADSVTLLRNALAQFLASERTDILLRVVIEKSLRLLALEYTAISTSRRLATAPEAIRNENKSSIKADFQRARDAVARRVESLVAELGPMTGDIETLDLQRNLDAAVAAIADHAIYANLDNRWNPAHRVLSNTAPLAARAMERIVNQWLAERQAEALAEIRRWPPAIFQAINQAATDGQLSEENKMALLPLASDDNASFISGTGSGRLYLRPSAFTPVAPIWMRYLPIVLIRHPLRRWLGLQTIEYITRLRLTAVERLATFTAAQIKEFRERLDAALRSKEEHLLADIDSSVQGHGNEVHASLEEQAQSLKSIQNILMSLLACVTGQTEDTGRIMPAQGGESEKLEGVTDIFSVTVYSDEVLDSLRFVGCPVCHRLGVVIFNALAAWQHRIIIDDAAQKWFAQSLGFCPLHTWQLASVSSPQGLSRGYPRLTQRLASGLRAIHGDANVAEPIRLLLASSTTCPLCKLSAQAEAQCLQHLTAILEDSLGQKRYSASRGVCLRHLPGLLAGVKDTSVKRLVLDEAASHLAMLSEDMQSFALKHSTLRRQLINTCEATALTVALEKVAGRRGLCVPWNIGEI